MFFYKVKDCGRRVSIYQVIYFVSQGPKTIRGVLERIPIMADGLHHELAVTLQRVRGVFQRTPVLLDGIHNEIFVVLQIVLGKVQRAYVLVDKFHHEIAVTLQLVRDV